MKRRGHKDPVTPELHDRVIRRDMCQAARRGIATGWPCVATFLCPSTSGHCYGDLTLDHVKDHPMMGKRAPSDEQHLVTLCRWHHIDTPWATSNRPLLREYLRSIYDPVS